MKKNTQEGLLDRTIQDLLQRQVEKESESSRTYLAMAMSCDIKGYKGAASLLYANANEEREHMFKFINYLIERNALPVVAGHEMIVPTYHSFRGLFEDVLVQEQSVTKAIHHIIDTCLAKKDYATFEFLQWFVNEQREEEAQAERILELFDVIGEEGIGLYTIDKAIGDLVKEEVPIA